MLCVMGTLFCDEDLGEVLVFLGEPCRVLVIYNRFFGVPTWLLTILCIFPQMSTSCEPLTVENVDGEGRMEAAL